MVDGEEADGGAVFWAHVGDGGPVRNRQLGDAGAAELHKPPGDSSLAQVLENAHVRENLSTFSTNCVVVERLQWVCESHRYK